MENFASILERDYGFKSGKSAPMAASASSGGSSGGGGYGGLRKTVPASRMSGNASTFGQEDPFGLGRKNEGSKSGRSSYGSRDDLFSASSYADVFGGPPKSTEAGVRYDDVYGGSSSQGAPVFDDLLGGYGGATPKVKSASGSFHSSPRRSDRNHFAASDPVYDELLPGFGILPKSRSSVESKATHDSDPFVPLGPDPGASSSAAGSSNFVDDGLLPGFESTKPRSSPGDVRAPRQPDPFVPLFDDPLPSSIPPTSSPFTDDGLLPGFGSEASKSHLVREAKVSPKGSFSSLGDDPVSSSIPSASVLYDDDPLNLFSEPQRPPSRSSSRPAGNGVKAERFDAFESLSQSPVNSSFFKEASRKPTEEASRTTRESSGTSEEAGSVLEGFRSEDISEVSPDSDPFFSSQTEVRKPAADLGSEKSGEEMPAWNFASPEDQRLDRGLSGSSRSKDLKDVWLTLDDVKLVTQPSAVPPPSRRPPPPPGSRSASAEKVDAEFVTSSSSTSVREEDQSGRSTAPPAYEQAVPGWMDFKIQRDEEKEREEARAARERRRQEKVEALAARESRENRERESREKEIKEREARQAREQERLRRDKEREKDRAAVRVATLEARERAAQEAREKAERSAVERVTGEARERAASQARARVERAAVERANAEARERAEVRAAVDKAASEARERADKAAAEKAAVERAATEARERAARAAAEKAAVERAATEARERAARAAAEKAAVERAAAEARERAERVAAEKAARERERSQQQRKSENDLESFFVHSVSPAPNDPRQRPASVNSNVFAERRSSSGAAATAASVDDWASIFGVTPNPDESSQENRAGDSARQSRSRVERLQHTRERAAKAIAEINQRDLETQREQAEKQRAGDILDSEIKRWAAGKEGNIRAMLSTLQYVLWPECGWTPVSLTDLINPAQVKKTYRKAALFVHPDKVQQKGATVQQKYIAEKVFDLLKEAFNKFNSEELF